MMPKASALPMVSLLVAMRNEERYIERCVQSLLGQDYPRDRLEILIFDGLSSDRSSEIASGLLAGIDHWKVVSNPDRIQSAAWNRGLEMSVGDIVGIVSAHAELSPDYVSAAVAALARTGADLVGGPVRASGETPMAQAVAIATSSRFGVGNAAFHYATEEAEVDTVFMGLAPRRLFERIGGFDPGLVRNQDDEFSYRLLDSGGRIVCDPLIRSRYFNRATLRDVARQYFAYGYWKLEVMRLHPRQIRLRHLVPAGFVLMWIALLTGSIMRPGPRRATGLALALYAGAAMIAAAATGGRVSPGVRLRVAAVFPVLHLAYGAGFLWAVLSTVSGRGHAARRVRAAQ